MVVSALRTYLILALLSLPAAWGWQQIGEGARFGHGTQSPDQLLMYAYRHGLGEMDGRSCPSWPVCSLYADQAVEKHGLLIGSWLVLDRLIHEHDDLHSGQWVKLDGEKRLYDPLSRNDFWIEGERDDELGR